MSRPNYGSSVNFEKKELRYVSVSQATSFSPDQYGGCNRAWWYEKIRKIEKPKTQALDIGSDVHTQIEHYEKTGEDTLGTIARQGKHFIPEPGPGILIEHPFGDNKIVQAFEHWRMIQEAVAKGEATPERAAQWFKDNIPDSALHAHNVPFVGYIDVVNMRTYWLDNDGERQPMPPKSVELHDHKTTSNISLYAKSQLEETVQMIGYAEWAHRQWPDLEMFRLSHGYFQTKGRGAEKRTVLISLDTVQEKWKGIEEQVLRMTQVARETDVKNIEPNYDSCNAYGREGCFYKSICPRDPDRVLMDLVAPSGASLNFGEPTGDSQMSSLFDMLNEAAPTTVHAPPPPLPVAPTVAPTPAPANLEEAKAKFLATEAAARAAGGVVAAVSTPAATVSPAQAVSPTGPVCKTCQVPLSPTNTSKLPSGIVWHMTDAPHDSGVSADAAQAALAPSAQAASTSGPPAPSGKLTAEASAAPVAQAAPPASTVTAAGVANLAEVKAALNGSSAHAAPASAPPWEDPFAALDASAPAPKNVVSPPDAPLSGPPGSALPISPEQKLVMGPEIIAAAAAFDPPPAPAPDATAVAAAAAAAAAAGTPAGAHSEVQERVKRKKRGEALAEPPPVIPSVTPPVASPVAPAATSAQESTNGDARLHLYVDCHVSFPTTDLEVYVAKLAEALCKTYNVADVRIAPADSVLGYGKWKGVMAAAAATSLPKGACSLNFVGQSELKQVVIEALRPHAEVFVRGVR